MKPPCPCLMLTKRDRCWQRSRKSWNRQDSSVSENLTFVSLVNSNRRQETTRILFKMPSVFTKKTFREDRLLFVKLNWKGVKNPSYTSIDVSSITCRSKGSKIKAWRWYFGEIQKRDGFILQELIKIARVAQSGRAGF